MSTIHVSLEEKLGNFSKDETELLNLLLEKKLSERTRIKVYPRGDIAEKVRLPTSCAQRRLWFIDQLEGGSSGYEIPMAVRMRGPLDRKSLEKALDTLVQRHETLRTVFVDEGGEPEQEIAAGGRFALKVIDLSGHAEEEREAQVRLQKIEEAQDKFDLRTGPLIRGRLLRVAPQEHVLFITMHHIVSDGWSMGIFIREFSELYRAYREGRGNSLEPLPIQYADYAQWQRQSPQGELLDKQLCYWRAHLEGAAPQLELPTDRPRPAVQTHRGANVRLVLDASLCTKLRALAQRHEMTLFMVLLAGWAILLSRLSGQHDVVVGTPVANRPRAELEGLIGFFVNTLALRVAVRGDSHVEAFLEQVKRVALQGYDHQDVPFEQVVEALQPQRSLNRNPLFQVMFALQNAPRSDIQLPGLAVTVEDEVYESSKFDLVLALEEQCDELVGCIYYATDLFDQETVERWMACFTVLLRGMTDEPQSCIGKLPILPERERHRVIDSFNARQAAYPHEKLIHELFEEQVRRTPDTTAVVYERQSLTYAELNARANQLARHLRDKGIGPDQLVGICVERGLEMIVGLLGILKAGGAYVPLDPAYPFNRLRYMLEDAAPSILLTQGALDRKLPDTVADVIALDGDWDQISEKSTSNASSRTSDLHPHHLAYVIYTSGSTGQPKGVMIEHRNVVSLWQALEHVYCQSVDCQRIALNASLNFDASVKQLVQLLSGRTIFVIPEEYRGDASVMWRFIDENQIHGIDCTPSQLKSWVSAGWIKNDRCQLRMVLAGGEAIDPELWNSLAQCSETAFYNLYGPTECTVDTTVARLRRDTPGPGIGHPMENRRVYILDRYGQPAPIGVAGEIHIGGAGVGRGYLNRSEPTSERFIADPFSVDPRARLYKTGDVGRWRTDGTLEYLGRNDNQVKIRGYRIEPGEIESQLARHEQVKEAVVIAREDIPGEKRLVAYVTQHHRGSSSVEDLRAHLQSALPEYMVPNAFLILESLPLTPNGKLDRRALPAPELGSYTRQEYEAPQGEIEEAVAGIWQELLRVERVGRQDNFFELGGHSLLATRVITHISDVLEIDLALRVLFEKPTIEALSNRIVEEIAAEVSMEAS